MTDPGWPVLTAPPASHGWDFGGFAYGLEPLTLPRPGGPDLAGGWELPGSLAGTCRRIRQISQDGLPAGAVERCQQADDLYWFRWIIGHQVSFIAWRLIAQLLDDLAQRRRPAEAVLPPLCHYVRGYSAMLLYSGSCPPGTYLRLIRPSMRLRHPSFSGSWAPDYGLVRSLLRGGPPPLPLVTGSGELARAVRLHQQVHDTVAARLVPDGKSLLRQSTVPRQDGRLLHLLYDSYFLTFRAPVTRHDVVAQLLRRLTAVAQDLAVNPVPAADLDGPPGAPMADEVAACAGDLAGTVARVAESAAGLAGEWAGGADGKWSPAGAAVSTVR